MIYLYIIVGFVALLFLMIFIHATFQLLIERYSKEAETLPDEKSATIDLKVTPKTDKITDSGLRNKIYHAKKRRLRYVEHNGKAYETGYTGSDAR